MFNGLKRVAFLAAISAALAAGSADARSYFGVRFGFPEVGVQLGATDVFGRNFGGRVTADFAYQLSGFVLGGDLLYTIPIATPNTSVDLDAYVGGGVGVGFQPSSGAVGFNLHLVLGLDLLFSRDIGAFVEVRPIGYGYGGYYYGGAIGLNFRI